MFSGHALSWLLLPCHVLSGQSAWLAGAVPPSWLELIGFPRQYVIR